MLRQRIRSHLSRWIVAGVAVTVSVVVPAIVLAAPALRTVALSGQSAPGTANGVIFGNFIPVRLGDFLRGPVVNDVGQAAFRGFLNGTGVTDSNNQAIWSEGSGTLALVARAGSHAPGTPTGVNYIDFDHDSIVLNDTGQTAFVADLTGSGVQDSNRRGIWSEGSGSLSLVARRGSQAPEAPGGANFENFLRPVLNNAGQTAFTAFLSGIGVDDINNIGVWSGTSGNLALVAQKGSQAPGMPSGVSFAGFNLPVLNDSGYTAFSASLAGSGVDSTNSRSLWSEGSGSLTLLARSGFQAPGAPSGAVFFGSTTNPAFSQPLLNNAGQSAFWARLTGGGVASGTTGIWSEGSGSLALVAVSGDQAPGVPGGANLNLSVSDESIVLNSAGRTAFYAGYGSSGRGIWSEGSGSISLVARSGQQAPGAPTGVTFSGFSDTSIVLNEAGQTAFVASLSGGNGGGIWATDRTGVLQLIARTGQLLEVAPGDLRTTSNLRFNGGTGNSDGRPSGFSNRGQLTFFARFTDGSEGIFVSNLVTIPEPSSLSLIAIGLIATSAQRRRRQR